jgi:hypothetical protein
VTLAERQFEIKVMRADSQSRCDRCVPAAIVARGVSGDAHGFALERRPPIRGIRNRRFDLGAERTDLHSPCRRSLCPVIGARRVGVTRTRLHSGRPRALPVRGDGGVRSDTTRTDLRSPPRHPTFRRSPAVSTSDPRTNRRSTRAFIREAVGEPPERRRHGGDRSSDRPKAHEQPWDESAHVQRDDWMHSQTY